MCPYLFTFFLSLSLTFVSKITGRLYQVEYALEAIGHAGTCLGILSKEGVILAAEKKNTAKLLDTSSAAEKIYKLDSYVSSFFYHSKIISDRVDIEVSKRRKPG